LGLPSSRAIPIILRRRLGRAFGDRRKPLAKGEL
jgi:hypothetical protein